MSETMRLDKLLAHTGFGTRSEVKKAIKQGKVYVDGIVVRDSGLLVNPDIQEVSCNGEAVRYQAEVYFMLNKPAGVISATEDTRDRTVIDLLEAADKIGNPFPVGRLDKDTTGLLLLTTDGQLAHELLSPKKHVDKTYEALVSGEMTEEDVLVFSEGVKLDDGYVTKPARLLIQQVDTIGDEKMSAVKITITEGKFHQVKRMVAAVGKKVVRLKRITMGSLTLDDSLKPGEYRPLTEMELKNLKLGDKLE